MQPPIVDAAGMQNTTTVLIGGLLSEYYIEVPEFQRGYSWEEQELIEFWDDLNEIFTREKSHYFGLIVAESNAEAIDSLRGDLNEIVERLEVAHAQQEEPNELVDGAVEPVNNQPPVVEEE